jgi:hypothetical protein
MSKTTKDLNAEIARLRAAARSAEKAEYETFGRWVVGHVAPDSKGSASERIDEATATITAAFVAHDNAGSVGHAEPREEVHVDDGWQH